MQVMCRAGNLPEITVRVPEFASLRKWWDSFKVEIRIFLFVFVSANVACVIKTESL